MTATRERAATMPGVDVSAFQTLPRVGIAGRVYTDRKSTRLNSSHGYISYAVFCLKKKKKHKNAPTTDKARRIAYPSSTACTSKPLGFSRRNRLTGSLLAATCTRTHH